MANPNDYTELVKQKGQEQAEGANKYAQTIKDMTDFKAQSVQSSVYAAQPANPDRQAQVMKLAQRTNLDPELVERNYDRINQEYETSNNNYQRLIRQNPKLSTWLEDMNNAKLAKDDINNLKNLEDKAKGSSFIGDMMGALASGSLSLLSGIAKAPALIDTADNMPPGFEGYEPTHGRAFTQEQLMNSGLYDNAFTRFLDDKAAQYAPKDLDADIIEEAMGGNYSRAARGLSLQIVSNLPQLGLIAATRGAGLAVLGASSAGSKFAENMEKGISPDVARSNAFVTAGVETGIEMLGGIGGSGFKNSIKSIVKNLGPETALDVTKESVKHIFKTSMGEGLEEFATSVAQDVIDYGMDVNEDGLDGIWQRAGNAFLVGAGSGGVTTGATMAPQLAFRNYQNRNQAVSDVETYNAVGEAALQTKLNERMPEKQREFLQSAVEGTPIQEVYMDLMGFETYFQKKGLNPAQIATELGLQEQYNQAKEAGTDIKLNYADWVASSVNTEHYAGLQNDIKFSADGMTNNQVNAETTSAREELEAANQETMGETEDPKLLAINKIAFASDASTQEMTDILVTQQRAKMYVQRMTKEINKLPEAERPAALAQANAVKNLMPQLEDRPTDSEVRQRRYSAVSEVKAQINADLIGAGLDSREARVQSIVLGEAVGALADASGLSPQQIREQFPLRIQAGTEPVAGDPSVLNQEGVKYKISLDEDTLNLTSDVAKGSIELRDISAVEMLDPEMMEFLSEFERPAYVSHVEADKGYGAKALKALETAAARRGADAVYLNASPLEGGRGLSRGEALEKLTNFYKQNGYKVAIDQGGNMMMYKSLSETLNQQGANPVAGALNQNDSRMVRAREQGFNTDQVFYHGTNEDFQSFDNAKAKRSYWGVGTYLSEDSGEAGTYGSKVLNTYIRSENQFDVTRDEPPKTITDWMKSNFPKEHRDLVRALGADGMAYNYIDAAKNVIPPETLTKLLQDAGYDSLRMGEIINVFDPKNIKSVDAIFSESSSGNIYSQQGDDIQGQIKFKPKNETFESIISLFQSKNQSTFAHESAHYLFNVMSNLAARPDSSQRLKDDHKALLEYVGVESTDQLQEVHQEKIARAWEAYLMEGKSPTKALKRAFANFKTWLTSIYKTVQGLENAAGFEIELTDTVRSIFDRMLMSQEQIDLAYQRMNYNPLFSLAGMNDATSQRYVNALFDARVDADNRLRDELMETERRKQTQFYKEERSRVEERVTKQIQDEPIYVAHSIITKGLMPDGSALPEGVESVKIDRKSFIQTYGEDTAKLMPRGVFDRSDMGVPVEVVAEMYGFETHAEFVDQMTSFIPMKENIQATVNAEMEALHPDMMADPMISENAIREIHNTERDRVYRMELEFLQEQAPAVMRDALRRLVRRVPSDKVMKSEAQRIVGTQKISEIRPIVYERAEAKWNKEAGELYLKGDIIGALEAKRKAALNNYLYKAAKESQDNVEKSVDNFRKMFKKDSDLAKSRDVDMVNAARAILAQFGITRSEKSADDYLQAVAKYDPDTYQNLKVLVESATEGAVNYKEATYAQFEDMANAVNALWDLSKSSREIEVGELKLNLDQSKLSLAQTLEGMQTKESKLKYEGSMTGWEKAATWLAGMKAATRIVEHWAIAMGGDFKKIMFDPVQDSATAYRNEKLGVMKEYLKIFKTLNSQSLQGGEISAPELGQGIKFKNKAEVLGAILHTGNASNLQKLLVGRGYGSVDTDGNLDTSRWDAFKARMIRENVLTKADFDWAQSIWDLNESLKPGAWKAHKKMYGFYPNEVTANEFIVDIPGVGVTTYRGGYVPAIADPTRTEAAATRQERENMEMNAQNSFMFPTTGRGFTKGRVDTYNVPLSIDINQVAGHIDKVLRFTHIEPAVKFVNRIVSDDTFRENLATVDKVAARSMLIPWLQRSASQRMSTPMGTDSAWQGVDKVISTIRTRTGMQIMGGNVLNALQNYTGLSVSMVLVKPRHLRNSIWDYMRNSTVVTQTIMDKSDYMKTILGENTIEIQKEISNMIETPSNMQKVGQFVQKNAYILQKISQDQVSAITWQAAYVQSIENGMNDTQASKEADSIVRQTQSSMTPEGSSRVVTGPPVLQIFMQFFSYFNNLANLNETQFKKIVKESGLRKGAGQLFTLFMLGTWMPAVQSEIIRAALSGSGFDEDDDDSYMDDFMKMFLAAPISFLTAQVPIVGSVANVAANRFNDKMYDDRLNVSPAISTIESMAQLPGDVYDAFTKKSMEQRAIRNVMNTLGVMTGLPGGFAARPLTYLNAIRNGDAEPKGPVDFTRGLVTGKAGSN